MKRLLWIYSVFIFLIISGCNGIPVTGAAGQPAVGEMTPSAANGVFPLKPGTTWVYHGTVRWSEGKEVMEKAVTWKMQVLATLSRGDVTGYRMLGHPQDLIWYQDGHQPAEYAILQIGSGKYYYAPVEAFDRLLDESDELVDLLQEEDLFLDLPLQEGKRFCETEQILREDGMYCWVTGKGQPVELKNVSGLSLPAQPLEYPVFKVTLPDRIDVGFTPGVGITHFHYIHHGSTSEVDLLLSEFQAGS